MTWWTRAWFPPASPVPLGCCRAIFFGVLLFVFAREHVHAWGAVPDELWSPILLFRTLGLSPPSADAVRAMEWVWKLSLATSALGLFTRASTAVAAGLGVFLLGLPNNFGKIHHSDAIIVLVLIVLAVSRSGDAVSLDALRRRRPLAASGEYTWPIRLVWVLVVAVFFGAGVSKLRVSGLDWATSDNMRHLLFAHAITHDPPVPWGPTIATWGSLPHALAAGSLALEVLSPLALLPGRIRGAIVAGWLVMQLGIWLLLGVPFRPFLAFYPFWLPWARWASVWHRNSSTI